MKSLPFFLPARYLMLGVLGLLALGRLLADAPRLGPPVVLANRAVQLSLTGQVGVAYSIQASSNLSNWFLVSTGIATNGWLTFRHNAASNYPTLFYRGTGPNDSLPPLTVALKQDTNLSASALVSLDGGSAVLYGRDGTRFTLSLPSNSIPDASIVTMTLVTNLTGLPFARGTLGTVLLEPADLAFWGAASLEIMFSSNINRREVISYFTRGDGSAFHLTPDRVGTNRILIPIARAGAYGSSLSTTQELANAARIGTGGNPSSGFAAAGASDALRDCFPEKQAAADQAKAQLDQARATIDQQMAALLGASRQRQMLDETEDSSGTLAEVAAILCQFYTTQVAPRWPAGINNCALGEVLVVNTLSVIRQRQLLNDDPNDQCVNMSDIPFCAIFQNCLADIRECCSRGMKGPKKVAAVFGLQRQDQLLGLNCISYDEAQEVIDLCSSNMWTGTFSMSETGSTETSTVIPDTGGIVQTTISQFTARFDGAVEVSQQGGDPDLGYLVELQVVGTVVQHELHKGVNDSITTVDHCPDNKPGGTQHDIQLERTEHSAAGSTTYLVSFITLPAGGGYFSFNALNYDPDNPDPPKGTISLISYQDTESPCTGIHVIKNFVFNSASPFFGNTSPPETSGDMIDPNVVSGSITMDEPGDPPRHLEFHWNFTRHVVTP